MAVTYTNLTVEPRAWSIGPLKIQILAFSRLSTDTAATITFDSLSTLKAVIVSGAGQSAAPTITNNGAVLALNATTADGVGSFIGLGV